VSGTLDRDGFALQLIPLYMQGLGLSQVATLPPNPCTLLTALRKQVAMQVRKWKARRFPYNPVGAQIRSFRPETQPHSQMRVSIDSEGKVMVSGCQCHACIAYVRQIAQFNPARFRAMIEPKEYKFFRIKRLHESEDARRIRDKAVKTPQFTRN
jgi:hypothetical protein